MSPTPSKSRKPKADAPADPNKLVRQPDSGYRTGDERFSVGQANGSWFLTDQQTADDFGQPRVTGPFATLNAVREAIPEARAALTSIRKPIKATKPSAPKPVPPPKPKTWLDRLPATGRRRAQRMIETLGELGLPDADDVARERMEGKTDRKLASRLLQARLDGLLDGADDESRRLVVNAVRLLSDGGRIGSGLPGWALVETDSDGSPTNRGIDLDVTRG